MLDRHDFIIGYIYLQKNKKLIYTILPFSLNVPKNFLFKFHWSLLMTRQQNVWPKIRDSYSVRDKIYFVLLSTLESTWPSAKLITRLCKCVEFYPHSFMRLPVVMFNSLNAEINPICHLLALLRAHHILHVSRVRVN